MLTEPRSKVSVPLTDVIRTLSNVPDKVTPPFVIFDAVEDAAKLPFATQLLDPSKEMVKKPYIACAALCITIINPAVLLAIEIDVDTL